MYVVDKILLNQGEIGALMVTRELWKISSEKRIINYMTNSDSSEFKEATISKIEGPSFDDAQSESARSNIP